MGLAEDLETFAARRNSARCSIAIALGEMPKPDRDALDAAFANGRLSGTGIAAALKANGYEVSASAVQRHRRRACTCP